MGKSIFFPLETLASFLPRCSRYAYRCYLNLHIDRREPIVILFHLHTWWDRSVWWGPTCCAVGLDRKPSIVL